MKAAHEHTWVLVAFGRYRAVWLCVCGTEKHVGVPRQSWGAEGELTWTTQR
jgi:hypothetical protein